MADQNVDILMMIKDGSTGVPGEGQSLIDFERPVHERLRRGEFLRDRGLRSGHRPGGQQFLQQGPGPIDK